MCCYENWNNITRVRVRNEKLDICSCDKSKNVSHMCVGENLKSVVCVPVKIGTVLYVVLL